MRVASSSGSTASRLTKWRKLFMVGRPVRYKVSSTASVVGRTICVGFAAGAASRSTWSVSCDGFIDEPSLVFAFFRLPPRPEFNAESAGQPPRYQINDAALATGNLGHASHARLEDPLAI